MPRPSVTLLAIAVSICVGAAAARPVDSHLDPVANPAGCPACHRGHGVSESPMLPSSQKELCLSCHGAPGRGGLTASSVGATRGDRPLNLTAPYRHPISDAAFTSNGDEVTCTSCHSPHRTLPEVTDAEGRRSSTRDARQTEYQLCMGCHGRRGGMTSNVSLAGRGLLGEVGNVSTHPFDVAAVTALPSIKPEWSGRIVNCTDCHGNSDPAGDRGPHESFVPGLLVKPLQITDGHAESTDTYDLCYECHDRESILRGDSFDGHRRHVVDLKISCETCHDPHGSASNRALIRIGDGTIGIAPSQMAGRLAFESDSPGSGSCYLTCHGYDHAPERYGPRAAAGLKTRSSDPRLSIKRRRPVARPHLPHLP